MHRLSTILATGLLLTTSVLAVAHLRAGAPESHVGALRPTDLDAAIRWGESGEATLYLLHHLVRDDTTGKIVVGFVYTPFVRVALAAKTAFDDGNPLTPEAVPPRLVEPIVYIAFRWYCCHDPEHGRTPDTWNPLATPVDYRIALPSERVFWHHHITATPMWVESDLSKLNAGGGVPSSDVVLLAGYPMTALSQPGDFIIYRTLAEPRTELPSYTMEVGHVSAVDVRTWR